MKRFHVFVRTRGMRYAYTAIAATSADVVSNAIDCFGLCAVTVMAVA